MHKMKKNIGWKKYFYCNICVKVLCVTWAVSKTVRVLSHIKVVPGYTTGFCRTRCRWEAWCSPQPSCPQMPEANLVVECASYWTGWPLSAFHWQVSRRERWGMGKRDAKECRPFAFGKWYPRIQRLWSEHKKLEELVQKWCIPLESMGWEISTIK